MTSVWHYPTLVLKSNEYRPSHNSVIIMLPRIFQAAHARYYVSAQ